MVINGHGLILLLLILASSVCFSQVQVCDRYFIYDLQDTLDSTGPGVYFKMTTDTNTANTGYTDLYFVDQFSDTLNIDSTWGYWLPSVTNIPNDTLHYVVYYNTGITKFPAHFNGYLIAQNPDCNIPFNYNAMTVNPLPYQNATIDIFPNPTQTQTQIVNNPTKPLASIELYDLLGQRLFTKTTDLQKIDLTSFDCGTYILKTCTADGQITLKKIIKN